MGYFGTLFLFRLKAGLRAPAFWICAAFFLLLSFCLGILSPPDAPGAAVIGILAKSEAGGAAQEIIAENGDYQVKIYPPEAQEQLRRDLLTGQLHCAYLIGEATDTAPVTVLYTEGSYLRPLMDQLVMGAYFEAEVPGFCKEYLADLGINNSGIEQAIAEEAKTARPFQIELQVEGTTQVNEGTRMQPLLYAVFITGFLAVCLLEALLGSHKSGGAFSLLAKASGKRAATAAAQALAQLLLRLLLLFLALEALDLFARGQRVYTAGAGGLMLVILAAVGTLLLCAAPILRRVSGVLLALLPPFMLISILFSGALIAPEALPRGLSALRFLSPAWYLLGWMDLF